MVPNITSPSEVTCPSDTALLSSKSLKKNAAKKSLMFRTEIVWPNILLHGYLNLAALYGAYLMLTSAKLLTGVWALILYCASMLGISAGTHRLWSHRTYKAKWPLRVLLMLLHTMAFQDTVHDWARNHRVHHKYNETESDPHNSNRGFFFSHYGWILIRKLPAVKEAGKKLDFSDFDADKVLMFQKRYYGILMFIFCVLIPSAVPVYLWGESWTNAYHVAVILRAVFAIQMVMTINSVTHYPRKNSSRPYDKNVNPVEHWWVSFATFGEGWHNFHHVFPWDYKSSELGNNRINPTIHFLNFCARMGWAYDLKSVPDSVVKKRVERTGDGSHEVWGWGDRDMTERDRNLTEILNKKVM